MGQPIVHFEIIGRDPGALRRFYGEMFDWSFATNEPSTSELGKVIGHYGFVEPTMSSAGVGIPGGIGGGADFEASTYFYVGVPDVAAALQTAESLGGTRVLGPCQDPGGELIIGFFTDPEGHLIGLANQT